MTTIEFLQSKLQDEIAIKARYSVKTYLSYWDEVTLKEACEAVEHYTEAIATMKAFNNLKIAE